MLMQESHAKAQAKQSQGSWFPWGTRFIVNHIDVFSLYLFITTWVRIGVKVYFFLLGSWDPVEGFLCARHTNLKLVIFPTCSLWYLPKCMYHQGQLSMCLALPQSWPMTICVNTEYTHRMLTKSSMARTPWSVQTSCFLPQVWIPPWDYQGFCRLFRLLCTL